jgi:hypothetical protein
MLTKCFNPACHKKLDYLRHGRVVRMVRPTSTVKSVEHYWLCGSCYGKFDFDFKADGAVALCPRRRAVTTGTSPLIDYLAG